MPAVKVYFNAREIPNLREDAGEEGISGYLRRLWHAERKRHQGPSETVLEARVVRILKKHGIVVSPRGKRPQSANLEEVQHG